MIHARRLNVESRICYLKQEWNIRGSLFFLASYCFLENTIAPQPSATVAATLRRTEVAFGLGFCASRTRPSLQPRGFRFAHDRDRVKVAYGECKATSCVLVLVLRGNDRNLYGPVLGTGTGFQNSHSPGNNQSCKSTLSRPCEAPLASPPLSRKMTGHLVPSADTF